MKVSYPPKNNDYQLVVSIVNLNLTFRQNNYLSCGYDVDRLQDQYLSRTSGEINGWKIGDFRI